MKTAIDANQSKYLSNNWIHISTAIIFIWIPCAFGQFKGINFLGKKAYIKWTNVYWRYDKWMSKGLIIM